MNIRQCPHCATYTPAEHADCMVCLRPVPARRPEFPPPKTGTVPKEGTLRSTVGRATHPRRADATPEPTASSPTPDDDRAWLVLLLVVVLVIALVIIL